MVANQVCKLLRLSLLTILVTLSSIATVFAATKNEDTPNLSFEKGTFEGWKRWYGYYGPKDYTNVKQMSTSDKLIIYDKVSTDVPATTEDDLEVWTENISGSVIKDNRGAFEVVASSGYDQNLACDNIKIVPIGYGQSMKIGASNDDYGTEFNYDLYDVNSRKKRAMAEKSVYEFTVTENSSLLTINYAVIIQNDKSVTHHDGGKPRFSINVYTKEAVPETLCISTSYKSDDSRLQLANAYGLNREKTTRTVETDECEEWECIKRDPVNCAVWEYDKCVKTERREVTDYNNCLERTCVVGNQWYCWQWGNCKRYGTKWEDVCVKTENVCTEYECADWGGCKSYAKKEVVNVTYSVDYNSKCDASLVQSLLGEMYYDGWKTVTYDLRKYIGKTIVVEVFNRDCLEMLPRCENANNHPAGTQKLNTWTGTKSNVTDKSFTAKCSVCNTKHTFVHSLTAGSHRTYAYFNASTQKMELKIKNCGNVGQPATITAPEGFDVYEWTMDGKAGRFVTKPESPNICNIPYEDIKDGVNYYCTMYNKAEDDAKVEACTKIKETFRLSTNPITVDFTTDLACYNQVQFNNLSQTNEVTMADGTKKKNDEVTYQVWSFYGRDRLR